MKKVYYQKNITTHLKWKSLIDAVRGKTFTHRETILDGYFRLFFEKQINLLVCSFLDHRQRIKNKILNPFSFKRKRIIGNKNIVDFMYLRENKIILLLTQEAILGLSVQNNKIEIIKKIIGIQNNLYLFLSSIKIFKVPSQIKSQSKIWIQCPKSKKIFVYTIQNKNIICS